MTDNQVRVDQRPVRHTQLSPTLPPELADEATRRLQLLALVYAFASIVEYFGHRALLSLAGPARSVALSDFMPMKSGLRLEDAIILAAVTMGFAMYAVARFGRLPPNRLLDLGLAFQVAGAFWMAAARFANATPRPLEL